MDYLSDDDLNLEIDLPVVVPYQYEPLVEEINEEINNQLDISDHEDVLEDVSRLGNTDWCTCHGCVQMPTAAESLCCSELGPAEEIMEEEEIGCLAEHRCFLVNCLDRFCLQVSLYEFFITDGPLDDNTPIHETYRYVAYRRFCRWIWKRLRKFERKVIPSCCVRLIRDAYPSEEYAGFKYARA